MVYAGYPAVDDSSSAHFEALSPALSVHDNPACRTTPRPEVGLQSGLI